MILEFPNLAPRKQSQLLYWRGYPVSEIARLLNEPYTTVASWKNKDKWDNAPVIKRTEEQIDARLGQLIAKPDKTPADLNEIEQLSKVLERTARIRRYENGGNEADLNPRVKNRNKAKKKKAKKNGCIFNDEQIAKLKKAFADRLFRHQRDWYEQSLDYMMRQYIKSRQIGATYYFALEAQITALETGKNQIFMSASKNQAHVFKQNIINFVEDVLDIRLKGDPIKLGAGTMLYFLGNNPNTAQSYSGDLYVDEYFWIGRFEQIQHVASGMAMHDDRRITYFSTPSTTTHEAYTL